LNQNLITLQFVAPRADLNGVADRFGKNIAGKFATRAAQALMPRGLASSCTNLVNTCTLLVNRFGERFRSFASVRHHKFLQVVKQHSLLNQ
jgi:hypothetical protein